MREFFFNILTTLDKLTGLQQFNKINEMPDPKREINELLDMLCAVCNQFGTIPEDDKKRIIEDAILADPEFKGLNAKIIFKWLVSKREMYIKPETDKEVLPEGYKPLTGAERDAAIKLWQEALDKFTHAVVPAEHSGSRIKANLDSLAKKEVNYKPEPTDVIVLRENIKSIATKRYKGINPSNLTLFEIEGFFILALTKGEAEEIYIEAIS